MIYAADLTAKSSLLKILRKASCLPNPWYVRCGSLFGFFLIAYTAYLGQESGALSLTVVACIAEKALGFAVNVLGFLLAGFTFFAALGDKALFMAMAKTPHDTYPMNFLQYFFVVFLKPIFHYWLFVMLCYVLLILSAPNGVFYLLGQTINHSDKKALDWILIILVVSAGTYGTFLLLIIGTFIRNLYYVVMFGIRWEWEKQELESARKNKLDK